MMNVNIDDAENTSFENKKPNVIMIMSEAYADFRRFEDQLDLNIGDTYDGL